MAKDFYQVLGLKRDADEKAIKGAYRKLAREHHAGNVQIDIASKMGGSDYAGYDAPSDGAVEDEVVEGEVTDKK